ncbi:MAG: HlyD family efflux transporter periplasmic adaptor subunit [Patescibacteria group bacterium]
MAIFSILRKHIVISTAVALVAIVIAVIAGRSLKQPVSAISTSTAKLVTTVNASTFRQGNVAVSANGTVEAHSQADLKSQTSAPVSVIDVSIGQNVYSGQVLIELSNSDIRAQLAQAEASLALAQGQYDTGAVSLDSARQAAIDKIKDAYIKTYDAIVTQADPILYNNNGNGGQLNSLSSDTALNNEITSIDLELRSAFLDWKALNDSLTVSTSTDIIKAAAATAQKNMTIAGSLLNDMSKLLNSLSNSATPTFLASLDTWKGVVTAAHNSVSGAQQSLTAASQALNTGSSSQGSTARAQIAAAQAGVDNLRAQLAKTIIRSPVAGKISALPLREGELASPGTLLATVIGNEDGLRIKAYVSGEDLSRIQVGSTVIVQDTASKGIVSNVAPGVDSTTKKAEVDIDVLDSGTSGASGLVIGRNVSVLISPAHVATTVISATGAHAGTSTAPVSYLLPIQDVKIIPGSAYVFTVDQDSKIHRNDVTLGDIHGDFVEVTAGLSDDMNIVTPVYELDEGQTVRVQ